MKNKTHKTSHTFCLFNIKPDWWRVIWEITNKCNYNCKYCIFSSTSTTAFDELSTEEIFRTIDELKENGFTYLKFTWGEPFIRPDMSEILDYAAKLWCSIDISTNASMLNDNHIVSLQNSAIKYVHVSLDWNTKEMQEFVRWVNTFDLTIRWINKLVCAWIYTRIGTVIHKWNEDYLQEIIEFVICLGVNEIIFSLMEPVGRIKWDNTLLATKWVELFEKTLLILKAKFSDKILINYSFTNNLDNVTDKDNICPGWKKFLYINNKWQVSPCPWISEYFDNYTSKLTLKEASLWELLKWDDMKWYFDWINELSLNWKHGCPKLYLDELIEQNEVRKLFSWDFEYNLTKNWKFSKYSQIYSFTTENIDWCYQKFDFNNKSVLAVTASWDHIINAYLLWANNVTWFDINVLAKYWSELKIEAIKFFSYEEFLDFFMRWKENVLSYNSYLKFRSLLSFNSRVFFDLLYKYYSYDGQKIRESALFNNLYDIPEVKVINNYYLRNEINYNLAKSILTNSKPAYIVNTIENLFFNKKFDLIFLSNIADYSHKMFPWDNYLVEFKIQIIDKLFWFLSPNWILVFAYMYYSDNPWVRNLIDVESIRREVFDYSWYWEYDIPSTVQLDKSDIISYISKFISNSLIENSKNYYESVDIYEQFSKAEDSLWLVFDYLKAEVKDKVSLDIGCWTGKYLSLLSPYFSKWIWLDVSDKQIELARIKCSNIWNIEFLTSSADSIDLSDNNVDIICATWCLGSISGVEKRLQIFQELKRVLKKWWKIILIENDETWEFEEIRWRIDNPLKPSRIINNQIIELWFRIIQKFQTNFEFEDIKEARNVFWEIRGNNVSDKVNSNIIGHNILVFEYYKM